MLSLRKSGKKVSKETFLTATCSLNVRESLNFYLFIFKVIWMMKMLEEMKISSSFLLVQQTSLGTAEEI